MSEPIPEVFEEYDVPEVGTVIDPQGEPGYRVRLPDGQVTAFPAASGNPCAENAAADIAAAIANPPPAPVPAVITRSQFVVAARRVLGITEGTVFAHLSQLPEGETQETARDLWENAREFRRENTFLNQLASMNKNTPEEIDDVFRVGAALNLD